MTPEGRVKAAIKNTLKAHGAWFDMPVPYGYGKSTVDFIGIHKGRGFVIEAKAPGNRTTWRQQQIMTDVAMARGAIFTIDGSSKQSLEALTLWLNSP